MVDAPVGRRILAIDPGTRESGWLLWRGGLDGSIESFAKTPNDELLATLRYSRLGLGQGDVVVVEQVVSYGKVVGADVFETVHWSGRFTEAAYPLRVVQLTRAKVKKAICGNANVKDQGVRVCLEDRFGGRSAARGTKGHPGPLYGISADVWSALAIAIAHVEASMLEQVAS